MNSSILGYMFIVSSAAIITYVQAACPLNSVNNSEACFWIEVEEGPEHAVLSKCELYGGTLATIPNQTISDFIISSLGIQQENGPPFEFYIGVNDKKINGVYMNYEGQSQTWTNWAEQFPQNSTIHDCVMLDLFTRYRWNDVRCDSSYAGICFYRYPKGTTPAESLESSYHTTTAVSNITTGQTSKPETFATFQMTEKSSTTTDKIEHASHANSDTTTVQVSETSTEHCICACYGSNTTINETMLQEKIKLLVKKLTISKKNTSRSRRRLISVPDNRISAQSIGYVGATVLMVVVGLIVGIDALNFCQKPVKNKT